MAVHEACEAPAWAEVSEDGEWGLSEGEYISRVRDRGTTIPQLFALLRIFDQRTHAHVELLVEELLARGCTPNDIDGASDSTIAQLVCRCGCEGMGEPETAARALTTLLKRGANPQASTPNSPLPPLHCAAFFGSGPLVAALLEGAREGGEGGVEVNAQCAEYENATPLHLAALAGSEEAVRVLLQHGADAGLRDGHRCTPLDCAKLVAASATREGSDEGWDAIISALTDALRARVVGSDARAATPPGSASRGSPVAMRAASAARASIPARSSPLASRAYAANRSSTSIPDVGAVAAAVAGAAVPKSQLPRVGDVVDVGGNRGLVRYVGEVQFKHGTWVGVQLDEPVGKNNGTVSGVVYFRCKMNHGIFAPPEKVEVVQRASQVGLDGIVSRTSSVKRAPGTSPLAASSTSATASPSAARRAGEESKGAASPGVGKRSAVVSERKSSIPVLTDATKRNRTSLIGSKLPEGTRVMVNGAVAVVKYVGKTEFGEGTWLGVAFDEATGKHDGSVDGVRYFSCKPMHGLFVRPNKATCRGINVADMLGERP